METLFAYAQSFALTGWAALIAALFIPSSRKAVLGYASLVAPGLLAVAYVWLLATAKGATGGFGTLAGVKSLFQTDQVLLAGWIHYLAFDMFVGAWITRDALERGVWRALVAPILLTTLMIGPAGLLVYLAVRSLPVFKPAAATA